MARWEPDARGRLERAALELYVERGFEQTTVAEIAARAGLTERTFFRHFADKREVLFSGGAQLQQALVEGVERAPAATGPLEVVTAALESTASFFNQRGEWVRRRQSVVAATDELRERELIKLDALRLAVADALKRRGVGDPGARLVAEAGIAIFRVSLERWTSGGGSDDLAAMIRETAGEFRELAADR